MPCFLGGKKEREWPSPPSTACQAASLLAYWILQGLGIRDGGCGVGVERVVIIALQGFKKLKDLQTLGFWLSSAPGECPGTGRGVSEVSPHPARLKRWGPGKAGQGAGCWVWAWGEAEAGAWHPGCRRWRMDDLVNFSPHLPA